MQQLQPKQVLKSRMTTTLLCLRKMTTPFDPLRWTLARRSVSVIYCVLPIFKLIRHRSIGAALAAGRLSIHSVFSSCYVSMPTSPCSSRPFQTHSFRPSIHPSPYNMSSSCNCFRYTSPVTIHPPLQSLVCLCHPASRVAAYLFVCFHLSDGVEERKIGMAASGAVLRPGFAPRPSRVSV